MRRETTRRRCSDAALTPRPAAPYHSRTLTNIELTEKNLETVDVYAGRPGGISYLGEISQAEHTGSIPAIGSHVGPG